MQSDARSRLKRFRQGSALAVALTGLILIVFGVPSIPAQEETQPAAVETPEMATPADPAASLEQATSTVRDLISTSYALLPKILIALVVVAAAALIARGVRALLQRVLGRWARTDAIAALLNIGIYLLAIAVAMTILAGDIRALLGSIGLVGLALSWALQTPIESFTGWLLNSFRGYYRVGDRIEVGEVFGDVFRIDVLTTTVWEAGGPGKAVAGAQATGAMITFPNWEVLRSNIVNYSREFPYVWDEVTVGIANESDLAYAMKVFQRTAERVVGDLMKEPVERYRELLREARLSFDIEEEPAVFISAADAWTNCTVRYLVPARSRRRWASNLLLALSEESAKPVHKGRIIPSYPRTEVRLARRWEGESAPEPREPGLV